MKERMHGEGPLLYIAQPDLPLPKRPMQSVYTTLPSNLSSERRREELKSFHESSIEEKIDYLLDVPRDYFQLRCQVITATKSYRGNIEAKRDDRIEMKLSGNRRQTIPVEDIQEIRLLSL